MKAFGPLQPVAKPEAFEDTADMATRSTAFTLRLDAREVAMLRQLTKAYGGTKTDVMRELVRDAYENKLPELTARAGFGFTFLTPQPGARRAVARPAPRKSASRAPHKRNKR